MPRPHAPPHALPIALPTAPPITPPRPSPRPLPRPLPLLRCTCTTFHCLAGGEREVAQPHHAHRTARWTRGKQGENHKKQRGEGRRRSCERSKSSKQHELKTWEKKRYEKHRGDIEHAHT